VGTRSSSVQGKRTPLKNRFSPLENLQETKSSDEEEVVEVEVDRPLKGKQMSMSKWDFLQRMTATGHPIIHDQEQLELTYRYIDLANSMLSKPMKRVEELEDMHDAVDNEAEKTNSKDTPPPSSEGTWPPPSWSMGWIRLSGTGEPRAGARH
jgi:hypothetical protein